MKNYSFSEVSLHVQAVEITGWVDSQAMIKVSRFQDSMGHILDSMGNMIPIGTESRAGKITFSLSQTSESNAFLSELVSIQENLSFIPLFCLMKDLSTGDKVIGSLGYIPRPAQLTKGKRVATVEWSILLQNISIFHSSGGIASSLTGTALKFL